ncbi:MAG: hypothetical protein QXF79_07380, partial [Ignisphaera sp.]
MKEKLDAIINYIDKCFCREYRDYILSEFEIMLIPKNDVVSRVTLVPKDIAGYIINISANVNVMSAGIVIGWIKRRKFIPSTHLFNLATQKRFKFGCAVVAKQQGIKAFLYGNDLLISSVDKFLYPIEKGLYVAVIDPEDMNTIGIGRLVIDPKDFNKYLLEGKVLLPVVEN